MDPSLVLKAIQYYAIKLRLCNSRIGCIVPCSIVDLVNRYIQLSAQIIGPKILHGSIPWIHTSCVRNNEQIAQKVIIVYQEEALLIHTKVKIKRNYIQKRYIPDIYVPTLNRVYPLIVHYEQINVKYTLVTPITFALIVSSIS